MKKALLLLSLLVGMMFFAGCGSGSGGSGGSGGGLPDIPSTAGGAITEEDYVGKLNAAVNQANRGEFLAELVAVMDYYYWGNPQRGENDGVRNSKRKRAEKALRGSDSGVENEIDTSYGLYGYFINDWSVSWKEEWSDSFWKETGSGTDRFRYFDYSSNGRLFLGGAYAYAFKYSDYEDDRKYEFSGEAKFNGKIEFRGNFKGSLEFKNLYGKFKFSYTYTSETEDIQVIGGSATISSGGNSFDLTNDEIEYLMPYFFDWY